MPSSVRRAGNTASSIAKQLRKSLSKNPRVRYDRNRINVISPTLCEDVLRRLQPSFPSTRPLDIIDINPGVCLWSSTIHNALKPRYHVLVEPDRGAYKSYVDPLLQQQGSRYRHVPLLSDLFSASGAASLPDQIPVTSNILSKGGINDSLLILANLTGSKAIASRSESRGSASATNLHQYIGGMMNQEHSLHHYGLVRMLAWLPDDEKTTFLPRTITERKKFSVRLDLATHVSEVAGGALDNGRVQQARRQHDLAVQSERRVAQRAKNSGVWDPENRRPPASTPPWYEIGLDIDALDQLRRLPHKLPWQIELLDSEDAWRECQQKVGKQPSIARNGIGRPRSPEPENMRFLRAKFLTVRKTKMVAQEWANRQSELDKSEIALHTVSQVPPTLAAAKEEIQQKAATLHAEIGQGRNDLALLAKKYIDDRRGFEQKPPLLQWDRRPSEPLVVKDDEFYPPKEMALLDLKPVPEALDKLNDFDKRTCFDYLCNILLRTPAQSVRNDLTAAVQGGLDDFIERVPDLGNRLKGGNPNLDDLRVRTLPLDLLVQLALALETWPFRMQTHEMIMNSGRRNSNLPVDGA